MKRGPAGYHHGNLPSAVVQAAVEIWQRDGVHALTFQALGRATGVTHAAVRRHFRDKDSVVAAVAARGAELLDEALMTAAKTAPADAQKAFLHLGRVPVEFAAMHPIYFRAMTTAGPAWSLGSIEDIPGETPFRRLLEAVSQWQKQGLLRRGSRAALATSIWATTHGLATLAESGHLPADPMTRRRMVDRVHQDLLRGLKRDSD